MSYIVAFNRDRDFYQVPLALHERGLLARLVTDAYYPDDALSQRLPGMRRLQHRRAEQLPSRVVKAAWYAAAVQMIGPRLGLHEHAVFERVDKYLSSVAGQLAQKLDADFFLYSGYAYEAFASPKLQGRRKGLFVFHPHHRMIREILLSDFKEFPECKWSIEQEEETAETPDRVRKIDREIELADFVVCASSFTARTLTYMGCPAEKITVVPYGVDAANMPFDISRKNGGICRFLFLGQGVQRKGLHHLFHAWRRLKLPDASLTIIASRLDPGIAKNCPDGVELLGKQPRSRIYDILNRSHVFVMPSLVEGFGHVYLEALSMGCFCIGTENTGVPDLHAPEWAARCTPPGNIGALCGALEQAYESYQAGRIPHLEIRNHAAGQHQWGLFRSMIAETVERGRARLADQPKHAA